MYRTGNELEDGRSKDEMGREVKYNCSEKGCLHTLKRKIEYMECVIRMGNEHSGIEEIMSEHENVEFRKILLGIKKIRSVKQRLLVQFNLLQQNHKLSYKH